MALCACLCSIMLRGEGSLRRSVKMAIRRLGFGQWGHVGGVVWPRGMFGCDSREMMMFG